MRYRYLGDRFNRIYAGLPGDPALADAECDPVRRNGRVIRGANRNQLVRVAGGRLVVVLGRRLRLTVKDPR
jgi:hypothetical protein